jgi:hypothetical protein
MTVDKYDELLERVRDGTISEEEVAAAAAELEKPQPETDRYTLLFIVGRRGGPHYRTLVEPYLQGPDDMLARLALWVLCWYWNLTDRYTGQLLTFLRGVPWDGLEEIRRAAASITGEYLRTHARPELLNELIDIFEKRDENPSLRQYAYYALADALGRSTRQLPPIYEGEDLDALVDPLVVQGAKARLITESHLWPPAPVEE